MKRIPAVIMAVLCIALLGQAFAYEIHEERTAIGADLTDEQIAQIYRDFGIDRGSVTEITVTNAHEREYLEGLVSEEKIGHKSLSCVYIATKDKGAGLTVTAKNINWCTKQMYKNALATAGITDANVIVSAPMPVSGTAALTGVYMAYEDITGLSLSGLAKSVGAEELILTGQLAEYIGSDEAAALINELKGILNITESMSDADVKVEIRKLAEQYNIQVTDNQVEQLLKLCRHLEKLDINALKDRLISITKTVEKASSAKEKLTEAASALSEKVTRFFGSVTGFFARLFNR